MSSVEGMLLSVRETPSDEFLAKLGAIPRVARRRSIARIALVAVLVIGGCVTIPQTREILSRVLAIQFDRGGHEYIDSSGRDRTADVSSVVMVDFAVPTRIPAGYQLVAVGTEIVLPELVVSANSVLWWHADSAESWIAYSVSAEPSVVSQFEADRTRSILRSDLKRTRLSSGALAIVSHVTSSDGTEHGTLVRWEAEGGVFAIGATSVSTPVIIAIAESVR